MSLKYQIIQLFNKELKSINIRELYKMFPNVKQTTVRGRLYDAMDEGIVRIGTGLYISSKAIIEHGNSLQIVNRMVAEGDKFDMIFLDIPYDAAGQKGGNRDLSKYDTISPEEFGMFMTSCCQLLKTDNSPLLFMFTSGKSSKRTHDKYINMIPLKQCPIIGTYQKLWPNGNPMNMGKFIMPKEHIYVFSKSGSVEESVFPTDMQFKYVPDLKTYSTAKPYEMIKKLITLFSKTGDWIFDPFGGSGQTLKACIALNRYCHIIDSSKESVYKHLIPKL